MILRRVLPLLALATPLAGVIAAPAPSPQPAVDAAYFNSRVAPVLARKCLSCHKPGGAQGELDLSTRAALLKGGTRGAVLLPGKPEGSLLYTRTLPHGGQKPEMPLKGEPLTPEETEALRQWIAAGAPWPELQVLREPSNIDPNWWAYRPLARATPPNPKGLPAAWARNPIDRFVFAKLCEKGLTPNPPADPRTLIRRATFDLTGLPPTPEEVEAFVRECAAERKGSGFRVQGSAGPKSEIRRPSTLHSPPSTPYDKLVDRLLDSPAYGEKWGRHWLDVVRFGESNGFERNVLINTLWPYRDYVIRSFNEDKPYDRFVMEQLAGDQLWEEMRKRGNGEMGRTGADPTGISPFPHFPISPPDPLVATAFLVCGPYDNVGNQDAAAAAQIRANTIDDLIRATSETFLATTVGCARCHDHKFDPVPTKDYYSLYATFAGVTHGERLLATLEEQAEHAARLNPLQAARQRVDADREKLTEAITARGAVKAAEYAARWVRPPVDPAGTEERFAPVEARYLRLVVLRRNDASGAADGYQIDEFEVWSAGADARNVALATNGGRAEGASRVARDFPEAYEASLTIDGKRGARWFAAGPRLTLRFARPERVDRVFFSATPNEGHRGARLPFVGDYRLEVSTDGEQWTEAANSLDRQPASAGLRERRLFEAEITAGERAELERLQAEATRLDRELAAIEPLPRAWVGLFNPVPGPFQVFLGGDPQRRGEAVVPASCSALDAAARPYRLPADAPEGERRLALARWLVAPDNPLTPRVMVNRIWQGHFGTGIVDTPSDFGKMGGQPTHPELLDYLAARFTEGYEEMGKPGNGSGQSGSGISSFPHFPISSKPWSLKRLHRLIMLSQAYQQSGAFRPEAARVDGESRLLWRFPPRRLSAEEVRDTALAISGKLDRRMGGPGFRLYDYQEDNVATYAPLDRHGPETYRRSIYHQNARAARVDLLTEFDCPDPAFAAARRVATTTPLQALTLLNHSFTLDMAAALAARLESEAPGNPAAQVRRAFLLAYARPPSTEELAAAKAVVDRHGARSLTRALLNSSELLYLK